MSYLGTNNDKDGIKDSAYITVVGAESPNIFYWYKNNYEEMDAPFSANYEYMNTGFDMSNYVTWSIVRNPYDRAIGWYNFHGGVLRGLEKKHPKAAFELSIWEKGFDAWLSQFYQEASFLMSKDVDKRGWSGARHKFTFTQCQWLSNDSTDTVPGDKIDYIIRFENFDEEFAQVQQATGIDDGIQLYTGAEKELRTNNFRMSKKSRAIIEEVFANDFEKFNY